MLSICFLVLFFFSYSPLKASSLDEESKEYSVQSPSVSSSFVGKISEESFIFDETLENIDKQIIQTGLQELEGLGSGGKLLSTLKEQLRKNECKLIFKRDRQDPKATISFSSKHPISININRDQFKTSQVSCIGNRALCQARE